MVERGVILAGGEGTRLRGITGGLNKHTAKVAHQAMIQYPLENLKDMGVEDVTIVSSYDGIHQLYKLIDEPQLDIEFRLQEHPDGMAGALGAAAVKEDVFVVLCGDCYYDPTPKLDGGPQLWWTKQEANNNGSVWDPETNRIIEKPKELGGLAVIGARVYDQTAIELLSTLKPSERGELELVDIDNFYLANGLTMSHYSGFFGDMGTPQGLHRVESYIRNKNG